MSIFQENIGTDKGLNIFETLAFQLTIQNTKYNTIQSQNTKWYFGGNLSLSFVSIIHHPS